jgi:hypothetical protein
MPPGKKRQTQLNINKWPEMVKQICNNTYSYNTVAELRELIISAIRDFVNSVAEGRTEMGFHGC